MGGAHCRRPAATVRRFACLPSPSDDGYFQRTVNTYCTVAASGEFACVTVRRYVSIKTHVVSVSRTVIRLRYYPRSRDRAVLAETEVHKCKHDVCVSPSHRVCLRGRGLAGRPDILDDDQVGDQLFLLSFIAIVLSMSTR